MDSQLNALGQAIDDAEAYYADAGKNVLNGGDHFADMVTSYQAAETLANSGQPSIDESADDGDMQNQINAVNDFASQCKTASDDLEKQVKQVHDDIFHSGDQSFTTSDGYALETKYDFARFVIEDPTAGKPGDICVKIHYIGTVTLTNGSSKAFDIDEAAIFSVYNEESTAASLAGLWAPTPNPSDIADVSARDSWAITFPWDVNASGGPILDPGSSISADLGDSATETFSHTYELTDSTDNRSMLEAQPDSYVISIGSNNYGDYGHVNVTA
jgi:hypothetical protein